MCIRIPHVRKCVAACYTCCLQNVFSFSNFTSSMGLMTTAQSYCLSIISGLLNFHFKWENAFFVDLAPVRYFSKIHNSQWLLETKK